MRVRLDPFVVALLATAAAASALPVTAEAQDALWWISRGAVALLFFGYGVRLRTADVVASVAHWRLHVAILATTYLVFPLIGLIGAMGLDGGLRTGVLLLTVVPSTMQSSVAFTSIARGNVAGAVVGAAASNLVGVVLTPLLVGLLIGAQADLSGSAVGQIALLLLGPFVLGQLLRPALHEWADRHRRPLSVYDRATILVIVFLAFSEGRSQQVWSGLGVGELARLAGVLVALLAVILAWTIFLSRFFAAADRAPIVFCGAHKSLAAGLPMAGILFDRSDIVLLVLPLMLYHQLQLMVCAWLAARWRRQQADR
jgi:sodium/bile acid cotransporter 7